MAPPVLTIGILRQLEREKKLAGNHLVRARLVFVHIGKGDIGYSCYLRIVR